MSDQEFIYDDSPTPEAGASAATPQVKQTDRRHRIWLGLVDMRTFALKQTFQDDLDVWNMTLSVIRNLPERKWSKKHGDIWMVPATEKNISFIRKFFKDEEIDVTPEAAVVLRYQTLTELAATQRESRRWDYLFNGVVPEYEWHTERGTAVLPGALCKGCTLAGETTMRPHDPANGAHFVRDPFKHQVVAADAAVGAEFFALLMEQGTGKTFVGAEELVAEAIAQRDNNGPPVRALIIAPKSVLSTWHEELEKAMPPGLTLWHGRIGRHWRGIDVLIEGLNADAHLKVWVINYDRVRSLLTHLKKLEFDFVIADEVTEIKNPRTHRSKACYELGATCKRRRAYTGTLMANSIFDVFGPFEFLQPQCLGYASLDVFKDRYGEWRKIKHWDKLVGIKNLDELKARIAKFSFLVRKDQCLDLPPKNYQVRRVEMGDVQRDLYDQMALSLCATLPEHLGGGEMEAAAVIAQLLRFSQITSGFIHSGDGRYIPIPEGDAKYQAALDLVQGSVGKTVIWCRFREEIRMMRALLAANEIKSVEMHGGVKERDRDVARHAYNDDADVRVFVGEAKTGGLGITLLGDQAQPETSTTTMVYLSNAWDLLRRQQSEDRGHRIGQRCNLDIYDVVCEGTVDETMHSVLMAKKSLSDALKDMGSIRALLLGGRYEIPKDEDPRAHSPASLRALLKAQGVKIPMPIGRTEGCESFDHEGDALTGLPTARCPFCEGDPMVVSEDLLLKYARNERISVDGEDGSPRIRDADDEAEHQDEEMILDHDTSMDPG